MEILTFYNLFLINSIIILFYVFFEFSAFDLLRRALFGLLDPALHPTPSPYHVTPPSREARIGVTNVKPLHIELISRIKESGRLPRRTKVLLVMTFFFLFPPLR